MGRNFCDQPFRRVPRQHGDGARNEAAQVRPNYKHCLCARLVASAGKAAYVAAKHGLVGLTKVIAIECANSGVSCNAICPGWVLTPLVQKRIEAKAKEDGISVEQAKQNLLRERQPMLKFITPEEIGRLAAFLCSEDAAMMTGASVQIDGVWTVQ
jgi:3-hydroxybutyrate dehydrogenase